MIAMDNIRILAVETTGKYGSASVIDEEGNVWSAESREEMNHLRGIISLIDEALGSAGISKNDLTHVAASIGPGSFTGIRIGVTTARTMAQMLGIPCIAVSSVRALAEDALSAAVSAGALYVVPMINARRHQIYGAVYEAEFTSDYEHQTLCEVAEEKQYMIEELPGIIGGEKTFFTGDGIDAYEDVIKELFGGCVYCFAGTDIRYQRSEAVARIALKKAMKGETLSYEELMPEYMRLAEAEQKLRAGTLSERIKSV